MNTRTKFTCVGITKRTGWGEHEFLYDAEFQVVTSDSEENKKFFAATPSGNIKVGTVKADHFEVGKTYYVDFTETE